MCRKCLGSWLVLDPGKFKSHKLQEADDGQTWWRKKVGWLPMSKGQIAERQHAYRLFIRLVFINQCHVNMLLPQLDRLTPNCFLARKAPIKKSLRSQGPIKTNHSPSPAISRHLLSGYKCEVHFSEKRLWSLTRISGNCIAISKGIRCKRANGTWRNTSLVPQYITSLISPASSLCNSLPPFMLQLYCSANKKSKKIQLVSTPHAEN